MKTQDKFNAQLERDDRLVAYQLLNDSSWSWLRDFYCKNFDKINWLISIRNPRIVVEDFCQLEPTLSSDLIDNHLFVYMVNVAIKNGVITKDSF